MGALIGFGSLVIAHSLSLDSSLNPTGDTMEMMRAVLDSNFWLATHVVMHYHWLLNHLPRWFSWDCLCVFS
jgi:hypothetical protein